jgi:O-antigen/teichoic acid export membrane protein
VSSAHAAPPTARPLTGVVRAGGFAVLGSGAGAILGFVLTLVVTRGLTTTTAGQFFSATAIFIVLQTFFSFGVGAGLVRFVPRFQVLGRQNDLPALLVVAFTPVIVLGVVGSVALWIAAPALASSIGHHHASNSLLPSVRILAAIFLAGTVEVGVVESTRAFGSVRNYVLLQQLGIPAARPLLVGIAIAAGAPLWGIVLAWLIPLVLALLVAAALLARRMREQFGRSLAWPPRTVAVRTIAGEYWSFTGARGLAGVMEILLNWLDVLLVAVLASPSQAAIYAAASRFITAGTLVLQALRVAIAGDVSASLARRDVERVGLVYSTASQWVVLSSWPLYLVMAVFAPTVLRVFGESYPVGSHALTVLCVAMLVNLAAGNVGTVLLMGGRSTWVLMDKGSVLAINVGANLVLVPRFGITGAAVAWAAAIVLDSALAFFQVRWGMGIAAQLRELALAGVLALGCFAVIPVVFRTIGGSSLTVMVIAIACSSIVYLPLVWLRRDNFGTRLLLDAFSVRRGDKSVRLT